MPIDEWSPISIGDELGADEAHVWMASLDQPADVIAKLAPLLSQDEHRRAERFYCLTDRRQFIAGRGILRKIISAYLALAPDEVQFVYNKYGKPFISDGQNHGALNFNLSHSNGMALYAVAGRRRVGVDIEYMREDFATLEVAERFFSKAEFELHRKLRPSFLNSPIQRASASVMSRATFSISYFLFCSVTSIESGVSRPVKSMICR